MQELSLIQTLAVMALPVILAVTVHEAAHAWLADRLGDPTARSLGRVTFNPVPHIDLFGTVLLPLGMYTLSSLAGGVGFLFGYAKPVPVVVSRLRRPRRDMALVALAGPMSNLLMAIAWALLGGLAANLLQEAPFVAQPLRYMAAFGILINSFLMVLNLLPLLPLDGGRVLASLLPVSIAAKYAKLEPWGLVILLALLFSGVLTPVIMPLLNGMQTILTALATAI